MIYVKEKYNRLTIGSIVSVNDNEHPEYLEELFFVYGFQLDIEGKEIVVALMDSKLKTFLTHIDNIILKDNLSIDDMFPPEPTDILVIRRKERLVNHEV